MKGKKGFAIVPHEITRSGLGYRLITVYAGLSSYADKAGRCWPSIPLLANDLGVSPNFVKAAIKELVNLKLVKVEQRSLDGKNTSNLYTLLNPSNIQVVKKPVGHNMAQPPVIISPTLGHNMAQPPVIISPTLGHNMAENNTNEQYQLNKTTEEDHLKKTSTVDKKSSNLLFVPSELSALDGKGREELEDYSQLSRDTAHTNIQHKEQSVFIPNPDSGVRRIKPAPKPTPAPVAETLTNNRADKSLPPGIVRHSPPKYSRVHTVHD